MKYNYVVCICIFILHFSGFAQHLPGGVAGAEIWCKTTFEGSGTVNPYESVEIKDFSSNNIRIKKCTENTKGLFNFNPSLDEKPCFYYKAPLESADTHNLFIVSDPVSNEKSMRHISTIYDEFTTNLFPNAVNRNAYALETQQGYASKLYSNFNQHQNTHVHFYSWSNYDMDKKFKSYGQNGETFYYIGKHLPFPEVEDGISFAGLLPEYISYARSLSDNERNRIESYLALKYGITLHRNRSYKNAKNKVFWDQKNNKIFPENIFGIGRDDISGLNQLQCESAHNRDYLVAATENIMETNQDVQNEFSIGDNNFLVFGDTGKNGLREKNKQGFRLLQKVWLAQATGDQIRNTPINFRLDLMNEFLPYLDAIKEGELVVWMLHDRFVDNTYVSDFDNGNVEYYEPVEVDFSNEKIYAYFNKETLFDADYSFFDQFTFAIGPEIIVQVRYDQWQCKAECFKVELIIEGGRPEYEIKLLDEAGQNTEVTFSHVENENEFVYSAIVCGTQNYVAHVEDANGATVEHEFPVEITNYTLELGDDQFLTTAQPEITLDAGQGIDGPEATYQWYFNGEQIYYTEDTIITDEPGEYCVVVTTSDMICQLEDCMNVLVKLDGGVEAVTECNEEESYIEINVAAGVAPYTVNVNGNGLNFNQVFNTNSYETPNIPAGSYVVTIEDAVGAVLQEEVVIGNSPVEIGTFGPDKTLTAIQPNIILDGTTPFNTDSNSTYEWYRNGELLAETGEELNITTPGEYTLRVSLPNSECKGEASITILLDFEAEIFTNYDDCDSTLNTLSVSFGFGIPNYFIKLIDSNGEVYYSNFDTSGYNGDFVISDIAYGVYDVIIKDDFGNSILETVNFPGTELQLNLLEQHLAYCDNCNCFVEENHCNSDIPAIGFYDNCLPVYTYDASLLITDNQQVTYNWSVNGENVDYHNPVMGLELCDQNSYYDTQDYCGAIMITVTITDQVTGCSVEESIFAYKNFCPVFDDAPNPKNDGGAKSTLLTKVYPNPSGQGSTFYYDVSSEENFDGVVELFDMNGRRIRQLEIRGKASYTLPFSILSAGVYFITTKTNGELTTDRIIIE